MVSTDIQTKEHLEDHIRMHAKKILLTQDEDGMIPSFVEVSGRVIQKERDIPRQAGATMALLFAQTLLPSLADVSRIHLSEKYLAQACATETEGLISTHLYRALADIYAGRDCAHACVLVHEHLSEEMMRNPIAIGLYLRLSALVPNALPYVPYLTEIQHFNMALTPRRFRFFDYADTLVWAKTKYPHMARSEYQYLRAHVTKDFWVHDMQTKERARASVVGKLFEVFAYYGADDALVDQLYRRLMEQGAKSQYAKDSLGIYASHILSQPGALVIDDVHTHVLMGLCYRYQKVLTRI